MAVARKSLAFLNFQGFEQPQPLADLINDHPVGSHTGASNAAPRPVRAVLMWVNAPQ
jgi:hypothetical protein